MAVYASFIKLEDAYQRRSTRRFQVSAVDQPGALTAMGAFTSDYAGLSQAQVLSYGVTEEISYVDLVDAGANIDAGITFVCAIGGNPQKRGIVKVPAPVPSTINADGTVDMTDALVTAFAANYLGGSVLVSDGENVDAFLRGKLDR